MQPRKHIKIMELFPFEGVKEVTLSASNLFGEVAVTGNYETLSQLDLPAIEAYLEKLYEAIPWYDLFEALRQEAYRLGIMSPSDYWSGVFEVEQITLFLDGQQVTNCKLHFFNEDDIYGSWELTYFEGKILEVNR